MRHAYHRDRGMVAAFPDPRLTDLCLTCANTVRVIASLEPLRAIEHCA